MLKGDRRHFWARVARLQRSPAGLSIVVGEALSDPEACSVAMSCLSTVVEGDGWTAFVLSAVMV